MRLDAASAGRLAALALACVGREFPNQPGHVMQRAGELDRPRSLHPAFFGCFDWHSAVHGHWLLAHLLCCFPGLPQAGAIRSALDSTLSAANLQVESEYLRRHPEFERPYGWAWALKLAQERGNLQPLEEVIVQAYQQWLPRQTYPVRSGHQHRLRPRLCAGSRPPRVEAAVDPKGHRLFRQRPRLSSRLGARRQRFFLALPHRLATFAAYAHACPGD